MDWDVNQPWYHGSPARLSSLRAGSTITQDRDLARIFSHKPEFVVQDEDKQGNRILKHSGKMPGYLYRIIEPIGPDAVYPHPHTAMQPGQEWLTTREVRVELIGSTEVVADERLAAAEVVELRRKVEQHRRRHGQP